MCVCCVHAHMCVLGFGETAAECDYHKWETSLLERWQFLLLFLAQLSLLEPLPSPAYPKEKSTAIAFLRWTANENKYLLSNFLQNWILCLPSERLQNYNLRRWTPGKVSLPSISFVLCLFILPSPYPLATTDHLFLSIVFPFIEYYF